MRCKQGRDRRPCVANCFRSGKQGVLACNCDRSDRTFDAVVVELDASVFEKATELGLSSEDVSASPPLLLSEIDDNVRVY